MINYNFSKIFANKAPILSIGAVNLDVYGETQSDGEIDTPGELNFSVGGSAYNVAANLANHGFQVNIFTFLQKNSQLTTLIKSKIKAIGIGLRYVFIIDKILDHRLGASGYLAIRKNGILRLAVSNMEIGKVNFTERGTQYQKKLEKAIRRSSLVIIDTNLRPITYTEVIDLATQLQKPVIISGVSEHKLKEFVTEITNTNMSVDILSASVEEVAEAHSSLKSDYYSYKKKRGIDVVFASDKRQCAEDYFKSIIESMSVEEKIKFSSKLCDIFKTKALVTIRNRAAVWIFPRNGAITDIEMNFLEGMSPTGAGDAVVAAVAMSICRHCHGVSTKIEWGDNDFVQLVRRLTGDFVKEILNVREATKNSSLTLFEEPVERRGNFIVSLFKQFFVDATEHWVFHSVVFVFGVAVGLGIKDWFDGKFSVHSILETLLRGINVH